MIKIKKFISKLLFMLIQSMLLLPPVYILIADCNYRTKKQQIMPVGKLDRARLPEY